MLTNTLFIGVPMGLKNLGEIKEVGVHDLASFEAGPVDAIPLGDLFPDGVSISGVDARGVAGIDISSVSGLSSILDFKENTCRRKRNKNKLAGI